MLDPYSPIPGVNSSAGTRTDARCAQRRGPLLNHSLSKAFSFSRSTFRAALALLGLGVIWTQALVSRLKSSWNQPLYVAATVDSSSSSFSYTVVEGTRMNPYTLYHGQYPPLDHSHFQMLSTNVKLSCRLRSQGSQRRMLSAQALGLSRNPTHD